MFEDLYPFVNFLDHRRRLEASRSPFVHGGPVFCVMRPIFPPDSLDFALDLIDGVLHLTSLLKMDTDRALEDFCIHSLVEVVVQPCQCFHLLLMRPLSAFLLLRAGRPRSLASFSGHVESQNCSFTDCSLVK